MKNKNQLILELFAIKEKHRLKVLYEEYFEVITLPLSLKTIAQMVNRQLGQTSLVSVSDIRYCRFYFKEKKKGIIKQRVKSQFEQLPSFSSKLSENESGNISWTNPDDGQIKENIKSKFSKK